MLLLAPAFAAEHHYADDFSTDQGAWEGGAVEDGVLRASWEEARLDLGAATSFTLAARVRAADGPIVVLGDLRLDYREDGGITLGDTTLPFPDGHWAWVPDEDPVLTPGDDYWDGGNTLHAEVYWDDVSATWFLYWTGEMKEGYAYREIGVATSPDGETWTPYAGNPVLTIDYDLESVDGVHVHMPTVAKDDGAIWHMYYSCYQNNVGNRVCHATSEDGLTWWPQGVAVDFGSPGEFDDASLREPDVYRSPDGRWWMLYNGTTGDQHYGPTGLASSLDGWSWTKLGAITADEYELQGGTMVEGPYGVEQWWNCEDVFCHSRASTEDLSTWTQTSPDPVLEKGWSTWNAGYIQAPTAWLSGARWDMWFNGYSDDTGHEYIGHARGVPVPGEWLDVALTWDGSLLTATFAGVSVSTPVDHVDALTLLGAGTAELDDVDLAWVTADEPDSGPTDSAGDSPPADTGGRDSTEPADYVKDTASGEPADGGCAGCASAPGTPAAGLLALAALLRRRRGGG